MKEPELKSKLKLILQNDFVVREEVAGISIIDGSPLRADFLVYPKDEIIQRGFAKSWIGIEVKEIDFKRHDSSKLYGTFWQAVCYAQTNFIVDGVSIRPAACAIYIGTYRKHSKDQSEEAQARRWQILLELGVYANTGIFTGDTDQDWALWFGQGTYFSKRFGMTKVPRGLKRYTGNTKKKRKPNQAPETTICTVTDRAPSSTLRASKPHV